MFHATLVIFDREQIDTSIKIEKVMENIILIKDFIQNFEEYINSKKAYELDQLITLPKKQLKKFYYENIYAQLIQNEKYWNELVDIQKCIDDKKLLKSLKDYSLVRENPRLLDLFNKFLEESDVKSVLENELKEGNSEIRTLNQKRNELHRLHDSQDLTNHNSCPFCGTVLVNLDKAYEEVTKKFELLMGDNELEISKKEILIEEIEQQILDTLKTETDKDRKNCNLYLELKNINKISEKTVQLMDNYIEDFSRDFKQNFDGASNFEDQYERLIISLTNKKKNKAIFSENEVRNYNRIFSEIFDNHKPQISVESILNKENYIQSKYLDQYRQEQQKIEESLNKNNKFSERLEKDSARCQKLFYALEKCNNSALKLYQTLFLKKIRVPLYLLSGRIIQNYQLGLGVDVKVKENQVYFRVADKDTDIFNILSMGQLNGVILALLLSIRKVYSKEDQLNLILIDDPLQSIDELSAHSFADLLAEEFSDAQLLLSTHEEDKSRLIQYKYKQVGKKTKNYNMQLEYLNS